MKKLKRTCELWYSEEENAYAFFPIDINDPYRGLAKDAELILSVEAETWKEACQKRNDYLDWGKYEDKELENLYGDWPFSFIIKENKIIIIINKPIEEVFEFTTNPKNTHLWIPCIEEELAEEYPPKINTEYKNRGCDSNWDYYKVTEFKLNERFTLKSLDENYAVQYSYKSLNEDQTEMEYFEWMEEGDLEKPFNEDILLKLKLILEAK